MQTVYDSVGYKTYYGSSNNVLLDEGTQEIEKKWTDTEGNIWYETQGVNIGQSPNVGTKWQALYKVDKSKMALSLWINTVNEYDPSMYPTENDPKGNVEYHCHRVEK